MNPADWITLAAVGVSGLAVLVGWLIARDGIKGQRDIAADERLWQRRADVYVELLEWCERMAYIAKDGSDYESEEPYLPPDLHARARAFASPYVYNQVEFIAAYHAMRMTNHYFEQGKGDPIQRAGKLVGELREMLDMAHQLSLAIREDLASDKATTNRQAERIDRERLPKLTPAAHGSEPPLPQQG